MHEGEVKRNHLENARCMRNYSLYYLGKFSSFTTT